jgi:hypothetical protein
VAGILAQMGLSFEIARQLSLLIHGSRSKISQSLILPNNIYPLDKMPASAASIV